jgi:hypothetical protein
VAISTAADNTHKSNVANSTAPTAGLSAGDYWYAKDTKLWQFRNFDNSATAQFFTSELTNTSNFYTTGTLNGGQKTVAKTDNVTLSGSEVYGTWIEAGAGCDNVTLPAVSANMSVCVMATATLDNLLQSQFDGKRLLIKMDLEGHEWAALRGSSRTLARTPRPVWMVEIVDFAHKGGVHPHRADIFALFKGHGYAAREIAPGNWGFE